MTKKEFEQAWLLANDHENVGSGYIEGNIGIFNGFGLPDFKPVNCTIKQVAQLINWQCKMFNGQYDMQELDNIKYFGRVKFIILPEPQIATQTREDKKQDIIDLLNDFIDDNIKTDAGCYAEYKDKEKFAENILKIT